MTRRSCPELARLLLAGDIRGCQHQPGESQEPRLTSSCVPPPLTCHYVTLLLLSQSPLSLDNGESCPRPCPVSPGSSRVSSREKQRDIRKIPGQILVLDICCHLCRPKKPNGKSRTSFPYFYDTRHVSAIYWHSIYVNNFRNI